MAGTRFQVKSYGANLVARHLEGVARHAEDIRPAAPAARVRVAVGYQRAFNRQGPGWAPLKASTIRSRIAEGYSPGPILHRSGSYEKAASNPLRIIVVESRDALEFAVDHETAEHHQLGTKKMQARPLRLSFGDRWIIVCMR
jgi:hypothetical protein